KKEAMKRRTSTPTTTQNVRCATRGTAATAFLKVLRVRPVRVFCPPARPGGAALSRRARSLLIRLIEGNRRARKEVRYALFQGDFMTLIGRPAAVCGALLFAWAASCLAATRPITEKDLLKFRWVADPQISPDGRQVAYVLVEVNE